MSRRTRERGWPAAPEPLPVPVVDNHTHLESVLSFDVPGDGDGGGAPRTLDDHLAAAAAVGVTRMVQVGCDLDAAAWTDALLRERAAAGDRTLLGALAVHPNEAVLHAGVREVAPDGLDPAPEARHDVPLDAAISRIAELARGNERVRAIGETGLDFFRAGPAGRRAQVEAFRAHIALAKELGLALQIHDRDAHQDVIDVLLRDGAPERTVFHCYSGDAQMAAVCAEHGWYLSFAGPVTFKANDGLREALRATPLDRVLVETDAPYLTPHPYRGRPNSPYLLPHTVRHVAATLDRDLADVCAAIAATSQDVYGPW
ncbi:TatD family hydrolase [Cellulomonas cellasea]|uniref:TatD family hydrolase n=1 Tax=Cellulomonas cellasea TaxID=43670 RepID=UPI0025A4C769|nr:TatD family hydrolase [Cellulomonas cellasea]MDM8083279.1 TatD family hydrolase [Cellulomonas cellasea]